MYLNYLNKSNEGRADLLPRAMNSLGLTTARGEQKGCASETINQTSCSGDVLVSSPADNVRHALLDNSLFQFIKTTLLINYKIDYHEHYTGVNTFTESEQNTFVQKTCRFF